MTTDLKKIHHSTFKSREVLLSRLEDISVLCGCFYCGRIYHPSEISDWCDGGLTAICNYCGIDAIIDGIKNNVTYDLLEELHQEYFLKGIKDTRIWKINDISKPKVVCLEKTGQKIIYNYIYNSVGKNFELTIVYENGFPTEAVYHIWLLESNMDFHQLMEEEIEKICNKEVSIIDLINYENGHGRLILNK